MSASPPSDYSWAFFADYDDFLAEKAAKNKAAAKQNSYAPAHTPPNTPGQTPRRDHIETAVNAALLDPADHSTWAFNISLFTVLFREWRNSEGDTFDKAKGLLDYYIGTDEDEKEDSFFTEQFFNSLTRTHFREVKQLRVRCSEKDVKRQIHTTADLLEKLIAIQPRNPRGHLQTIIAVIAAREFPDLIELDPEFENQSELSIAEMYNHLSPFST